MKKKLLQFLIIFFILIISVIIAMITGATDISDLLSSSNRMILFEIRLPRVLLAGLCGSALSLAGLIFQSLLSNPLAEPYTLGISGGAALGVGLSVLLSVPFTLRPFFSATGSILSVVFVFILAEYKRFSSDSVVLAGVVTSYLFSSIVLFLFALLQPKDLNYVMLWLMGDLSSASIKTVIFTGIILFIFFIFFFLIRKEMDVLSFDEEKVQSLGLNASLWRKSLFFIASLMTAICVSVAGVIGFAGLIVPQIVRKTIGGRHQLQIPAVILIGAAFLILCDAISRRIIRPVELPVGIISGLCGGIFFLSTFLHRKKGL